MNVTIIFGSTLGNTERVADMIEKEFSGDVVNKINIKDITHEQLESLASSDLIIFGTSTWGVGDMQDDWDSFDFKKLSIENKVVAIYGLGDSEVYAWTYCDAISKMHRHLKMKKAKIIGYVPTSDYKFTQSESVEDDHFLGLALDEDNYEDLTPGRVQKWVAQLKESFK